MTTRRALCLFLMTWLSGIGRLGGRSGIDCRQCAFFHRPSRYNQIGTMYFRQKYPAHLEVLFDKPSKFCFISRIEIRGQQNMSRWRKETQNQSVAKKMSGDYRTSSWQETNPPPEITWFRKFVEASFGSPERLLIFGVMFLSGTQFLPHAWPEDDHAQYSVLVFGYFVHELLRDLGIAFLVSVSISVAIEKIAAEKRDREINKKVHDVQQDAMAAVFNTTLPPGWLNFVRTTLQNKIFYRTNMRVRYDVRIPTNEEQALCSTDFVVCNVTLSYRVTNTSFSNEDYEVDCYVELPWEKELRSLPHLQAIIIDGEPVDIKELEGARIGTRMRFGHSYKHPVKGVRGQDFIDVEVRLRQVNYPRDTTTFTSIDPTDSLHVQLVAPQGYSTYVILKHPNASDHGEGRSPVPLHHGNAPESDGEPDALTTDQTIESKIVMGPSGAPVYESVRTGVIENDTWVFAPSPCFPSTCVELSWVDKIEC